jgi:GTP cyclohydrolase I
MALNKDKTDSVLGWEVHDHLRSLGIETPMNPNVTDMMDKQKLSLLEDHFEKIMELLGLDMQNDSMQDSPRRLAKMYVNELFWGMDHHNFPKCTAITNSLKDINTNQSFVLERGIRINSTCEHHFVPIQGKATVAYLPREKMLGLSKLNRIVEYFARRPQVQERMTEQIKAAIMYVAETSDVAVYIDAEHFCVKTRGIQDVDCSTVTLAVGGIFTGDTSDIRREFLNLARMQ